MKEYYDGSINRISKIILKIVSSDETFLEQASKEKKEKVPFLIKSKYKVITDDYEGHEFHTLNAESNSNKHIIYFHGGALCLNGGVASYLMVNKWIKKTDAKATYMVYPMIPKYKTSEIYDISLGMYQKIIELYPDDEFIFIGDSAGALVILSMFQLIKQKQVKIPKATVFISPWLDFSLSNPDIKAYEDKDQLLSLSRFKGLEAYDTINHEKKVVSPMDYDYQESIDIYMGTNDILYPDACLFEEKNKHINLKIFNECPHVFPLFPLKQSDIVHSEIIELIRLI